MSAPSQTGWVEIAAQARHGDRVEQRTATSSLLVINNFSAFRHETALFVSAVGSSDVGAVTDTGSRKRGPVSLSFVVPFVPGHRYYGAAPAATVSAPAGWTGGARTGSGPWTYTYVADTQTPGATPDFGFTFIALSEAGSGENSQQAITVNASAPFGAGTASFDA